MRGRSLGASVEISVKRAIISPNKVITLSHVFIERQIFNIHVRVDIARHIEPTFFQFLVHLEHRLVFEPFLADWQISGLVNGH